MGLLDRLMAGYRGIQNAREFREYEADPANQGRPLYAPPVGVQPPAWLDPRQAGDMQYPNSVSAHLRQSPSTHRQAQSYLSQRPGQAMLPDALSADAEPWRQPSPEQIGERVTPLEVGGAAYTGGMEPESAPGGMPGVDLNAAWHQAYRNMLQSSGGQVPPMSGDFPTVERDMERQRGLLGRMRRPRDELAMTMRRRWQ